MIDLLAWISVSAITLCLTLVALYYALKRTTYNEETLKVAKSSLRVQRESLKLKKLMLRESRAYWGSWDKRAKDVSKRVLEQMTEEELEKELIKKRMERERKSVLAEK